VPTWAIVLSVAGSVVTGGYRLVRYRMRLRFLRDTFNRNGDRKDLEVAGRVTSPGWTELAGRKGQAVHPHEEPDPIERVLRTAPGTPA
jgi:hypothetical protein